MIAFNKTDRCKLKLYKEVVGEEVYFTLRREIFDEEHSSKYNKIFVLESIEVLSKVNIGENKKIDKLEQRHSDQVYNYLT